jgi:hypothetical protein
MTIPNAISGGDTRLALAVAGEGEISKVSSGALEF